MNSPVRILMVDDNALLRRSLKSLLADEMPSAVCTEAENSSAAMKALDTSAIDIVLLDLNLPDVNGAETARRITEKFPHIQIVLMSSNDAAPSSVDKISVGANAWIDKSRMTRDLVPTLTKLFVRVRLPSCRK